MTRPHFDTNPAARFRTTAPRAAMISGLGRPLILACVVAGIALASGCSSSVSDRTIRRIDAPLATRAHADQRTVFVDVRTPEEFAAGHIPGAVNLRLTDIPSDNRPVPALRDARRIVVYGQNPGTAVAVAMTKRLVSQGQYSGVELFEGGLDAWRAAGGSVQRDTQ